MEKEPKKVSEQLVYAGILDKGMKIGLLIILVTFIIYLSGLISPYIPVSDLPKYWGLPVHKYLEETGIHPGWSWMRMIDKGDFLNFMGICFLAGITMFCYIRVIPIFFRKKNIAYGVIALLEVLILILAASGILKAGGH